MHGQTKRFVYEELPIVPAVALAVVLVCEECIVEGRNCERRGIRGGYKQRNKKQTARAVLSRTNFRAGGLRTIICSITWPCLNPIPWSTKHWYADERAAVL
jgi:hypothetical protein